MFLLIMGLVPVLIWAERKGAAFIQDRTGPNRAGIAGIRLAGLVHPIADVLKLLFKEDVHAGQPPQGPLQPGALAGDDRGPEHLRGDPLRRLT